MELPLPVAALVRRARNAKSPKERHDTAYFAWEASIRLALAARPPADPSSLALASVGQWVGALELDGALLAEPALLAALALFTEVGAGRRASPRAVTGRMLLDALPAYRNHVIGHGSMRSPEFYEEAAGALLEGLVAGWGHGRPGTRRDSGREEGALGAPGSRFGALAWSPDGRRLAAWGGPEIRIFDCALRSRGEPRRAPARDGERRAGVP